jgi:hypothetical protein
MPTASAAAGVGAARPLAVVLPAQGRGLTNSCRSGTGGSCPASSPNWAGYVVTPSESNFTAVSASWVVPAVTCPKRNSWTVFWVGLDGWGNGNNTVEQGGTSAQCSANSNGRIRPVYEAWWEMWPEVPTITFVPFSPPLAVGDTVSASVGYTQDTGVYAISVEDDTTGQSFTQDDTCTGIEADLCQNASAEWVAESPEGRNGSTSALYPLADFHTMKFADAQAVDGNGDSGTISSPSWADTGVDMASTSSGNKVTVDPLQKNGAKFGLVWDQSL